MQAGEMNIDPIEAEFFSTDALGSLTDAFVREAIQNSLDARIPGGIARIRITFPAPAQMLRGDESLRFTAGLWPHLNADRSGLTQLPHPDRKSTRLNSSHPSISYAVFCLKKKKR